MKKRVVFIAADHAGVDLKAQIQKDIPNITWHDLGPASTESVDFADFAKDLAHRVIASHARGILICGSGIGMSIAANKIKGIRAACVDNAETARLSREHNDSNVLCLGARFLAPEYACELVRIWLETPFSNDERHKRRIAKIHALEE